MRNKTTLAQSVNNSIRVRLSGDFKEPLAFAREYGGSLQMQSVGGMYKVAFVSVDKRAHAWGGSLRVAYENMVRMFEEKYGV